MADTRHRAYRSILWYITSFCLTKVYSDGVKREGLYGFHPTFGDESCRIGDLVVPTSAPVSQWCISWLRDVEVNPRGYRRFLLESIETGEICWWSNIGISYLERGELARFPEWQWIDRQFSFNDRWKRVCYKKNDAYIVVPLNARFGEGYEVTLSTRSRFGLGEGYYPEETFPDWRKVTMAMMDECYKRLSVLHERQRKSGSV